MAASLMPRQEFGGSVSFKAGALCPQILFATAKGEHNCCTCERCCEHKRCTREGGCDYKPGAGGADVTTFAGLA